MAHPRSGENTFNKQCWRFIEKNYGNTFENWTEYCNCRRFMHKLTELGLTDKYYELIWKQCNFLGVFNARLSRTSMTSSSSRSVRSSKAA